jgi:hypothetical protein
MIREDLRRAPPEALAAITSAGLVRRARRELDEGYTPAIEVERDALCGAFPDGVTARLTAPPLDGTCSCGAPGVCRHRVALALAWRDRAPIAAEAWSPGDLPDAALTAALGRRLREATTAARAGVVVDLRPDGGVPTATLPQATVRFWVPGALAWARCDCKLGGGCAHVAIAVWAFRAAASGTVTVTTGAAPRGSPGVDAQAALVTLLRELLGEGLTRVGQPWDQAAGTVRADLDAAGLRWLVLLLDALRAQVTAWRERSGRFDPVAATALVASLQARTVARGPLPQAWLLGHGEPAESSLDPCRLVSLGVRVTGDASQREARLLLADPASATLLVLHRRWSVREGMAPEALASRALLPGVTLGAAARGQLVTQAGRRTADRQITFGRGPHTSALPQEGAWDLLPPSLRAPSVAALLHTRRERPPALLRPPLQTDDVAVLQLDHVEDLAWHAGRQTLHATVVDAWGDRLRVERAWRAAAPQATDTLARALQGPVQAIAGELRHGRHGLVLDPTAVMTDRLVLPDLDPPGGAVALPSAPDAPEDPLARALYDALDALAAGLLAGETDALWRDKATRAARALRELGLQGAADRLAGAAWGAAAVRVLLAVEARAG